MNRAALCASYICAAVAAASVALHFNAERFPAWTQGYAVFAGLVALAGALFAAWSLGRRGWTRLEHWRGQLSLAINGFLAAAFFAYPLSLG